MSWWFPETVHPSPGHRRARHAARELFAVPAEAGAAEPAPGRGSGGYDPSVRAGEVLWLHRSLPSF